MIEKNNQSTSGILNILNETSSDYLVLPGSEEQKKRTKEFDELLHVARSYSIYVNNLIIDYWRKQTEKAKEEKEEFQIEMKFIQEKLNQQSLLSNQNQLSAQQFEIISFIQKTLQDLLAKINNKILILNQRVNSIGEKIYSLQKERDEIQATLKQGLLNCIDVLSITNTIRIHINTPTQYHDQRDKSEKFIEWNGSEIKKILTDIEKDLERNNYQISKLNDIFQDKIAPSFRQKLDEYFSYLSTKEKESAINYITQDIQTKKLLDHQLLNPIIIDSNLFSEMKKINAIDKDIELKEAERKEAVDYRDILTNVKDSSFFSNLGNVSIESKNNSDMEQQLTYFTENLTIINDFLNQNEDIFNEKEIEIKLSSKSADDLLGDLDLFEDEIKQSNPDQLEILEKRQSELEDKIEEFEDNLSKKDKEFDHEIENNQTLKNTKK